MNPDNRAIAEELEQTQNQLRAQVVINRDGKTELEALVERMKDQRLPGLDVAAEPLPDELTFRDASNQVIIRALAQMAKVNVVFDPAFRPSPISIEIRNQTFAEALQSITASTQNFLSRDGAADDHDHPGHPGQTARVPRKTSSGRSISATPISKKRWICCAS